MASADLTPISAHVLRVRRRECCGCRITPAQLQTYSVRNQLVSKWALGRQDNGAGVIAVVGATINDPGGPLSSNGCGKRQQLHMQRGCSPTLALVTAGATNLLGSITHDQLMNGMPGLTEGLVIIRPLVGSSRQQMSRR
jgi:hypothetical protein